MNKIAIFLLPMLLLFSTSQALFAEDSEQPRLRMEAELASVFQSRNDIRIPGKGGTQFDLSEFSSGPFFTPRLYISYFFNKHHSLRLLYAPFRVEVDGISNQNILFDGTTFPANVPFKGRYKFNSYRLAYIYSFDRIGAWQFRVGFSAKVRDASVALDNGNLIQKNENIGFVPLAYGNIAYHFTPKLRLDLDIEALAAPQGRAEDVALKLYYQPREEIDLGIGYRMLEGGADNDTVYTFAWIHYLVFSLGLNF
jgi:hypothetical protein